jgi:energy-coupling factor transporter transmembrane protein EcfT
MCTPATIYFVISVVFLIFIAVTNLDSDQICIGDYNCYMGNNTIVFILNAVYILFWTFILDLMCKAGYAKLSWLVLLLPFIILFIAFTSLMVEGNGPRKKNKNNTKSPEVKARLKERRQERRQDRREDREQERQLREQAREQERQAREQAKKDREEERKLKIKLRLKAARQQGRQQGRQQAMRQSTTMNPLTTMSPLTTMYPSSTMSPDEGE